MSRSRSAPSPSELPMPDFIYINAIIVRLVDGREIKITKYNNRRILRDAPIAMFEYKIRTALNKLLNATRQYHLIYKGNKILDDDDITFDDLGEPDKDGNYVFYAVIKLPLINKSIKVRRLKRNSGSSSRSSSRSRVFSRRRRGTNRSS